MAGSCSGKRALVTGASSGIGAEATVELSREGATVLAVARDAERLERTLAAARAAGGDPVGLLCDLTEEGAAAMVARKARQLFTELDVLVNSAGAFEPLPFRETTMESLDRQWRINVRAPFELTRELLPQLHRGSSVIFLSSICGHTGFPNSAAYCGTKGAVELITQALAIELGPEGIRVNCVAPGWISTRMNDHLLADTAFEQAQIDGTPLGRIGRPDEIAPAIAHLASDASRFMTGASVHIDGGYPAAPPLSAGGG